MKAMNLFEDTTTTADLVRGRVFKKVYRYEDDMSHTREDDMSHTHEYVTPHKVP